MITKTKIVLLILTVLLIGCGPATAVSPESSTEVETEEIDSDVLTLPVLEMVQLNGEPLRVVATTSIIGDVVAQVGGDAITLTTLIDAGQDPHSYEPAARDLTAVSQAHVIFINGWNLEEALVEDLEQIGESGFIIPISAGITPLAIDEDAHQHEEGEHEEDDHDHEEGEHEDSEHDNEDGEHEEDDHDHAHGSNDPHVWFDIDNVTQWVNNTVQTLTALDPANGELYAANAEAYIAELTSLAEEAESELSQIPEERRFIVTNHDSFGYLAQAYGFEIIGTVLPSASTVAEPSASDLAALIEEMDFHNVCTIFSETTVSDTLAQTVANELNACETVAVVPLYTGAIGTAGSGADSYIGMVRANVAAIVDALK